MKRFLCTTILCSLTVFAQPQSAVRIAEYSAAVSIDALRSEITATASVWLRVTADSIDRFRFSVPSQYEINAVRDIDDDRLSYRQLRTDEKNSAYSVELPSHRIRNDSFFVKIGFEASIDTSSHQKVFVNPREFMLINTAENAWLPSFDSFAADRSALQLSVGELFTVAGKNRADSLFNEEGMKTYFFSEKNPAMMQDFFSLCGSASISEINKYSSDSLISISLFVTPSRFDARFADSLLSFLVNAASFYKDLTGNRTFFTQHFIFIGEDNADGEIYRIGNVTIERNSPAYTMFDSTVFRRSIRNPWLLELARSFCLTHSDSLAFFDEGWAGYLATRYLLTVHNDQNIEQRERLDLMINALSFYPANPLSAGRNNRMNEKEVLSFKGRYIFLMLQKIIGTASFDRVIKKTYEQFSGETLSLTGFRRLCEEEYESSLEWFFQQWLDRASVPEYVFQWKYHKTQRGIIVINVSIEQRGDVFSSPLTLFFTFGQKRVPKQIFVEQAKQDFSFQFSTVPGTVELDPNYSVLRWILDIRILAHARSSRLYRVYNKDVSTSEREALLTLNLDPVNATGSAPIAYFSLGKLAVIERNPEKAKENFMKAMQSHGVEEASLYPLLSLVRFANVLEMEGKRTEAVPLYERAAAEGRKNPSLFAPVIIEAEKYIRSPFVSTDEFWYGLY